MIQQWPLVAMALSDVRWKNITKMVYINPRHMATCLINHVHLVDDDDDDDEICICIPLHVTKTKMQWGKIYK